MRSLLCCIWVALCPAKRCGAVFERRTLSQSFPCVKCVFSTLNIIVDMMLGLHISTWKAQPISYCLWTLPLKANLWLGVWRALQRRFLILGRERRSSWKRRGLLQDCVLKTVSSSAVRSQKINWVLHMCEWRCDRSWTLLRALLTRKKNPAKVLVKSSCCLILGKKGRPGTGIKQKKKRRYLTCTLKARVCCWIQLRHSRTAYRDVNPKTFFTFISRVILSFPKW